MHERGLHTVLTVAPVGPSHLRPLLGGLPDALEIFVHNLVERIHAAMGQDRPLLNPWCTFGLGRRCDTRELPPGMARAGLGWAYPEGGTGGRRRVRPVIHKPRPGLAPPWDLELSRDGLGQSSGSGRTDP